MKLFITGALGFVGRELITQCKQQGIETITVDLFPSPSPNHYQADIRSPGIVNIIPEGADAIIHLAGLTRDTDCKDKAYECFDANVMATLNLMRAAKQRNVKQFIFASSEWVYGEWSSSEVKHEDSDIDITSLTSEYALSKLVCEACLRQKYKHGFCNTTILRFGIIYGERPQNWSAVEALFHAVKTKEEVTVGSLQTGRCFIHVSDIANGIIKSVGLKGFNITNLGGDHLVTLGDIISESKKILNKDPRIVQTAPEKISIRNVSNAKAIETLDWRPKISMENGLLRLHTFLSA